MDKEEQKQKRIFLSTEGDEWYRRNSSNLKKKSSFIDIDQIIPYIDDWNRILEIGCSDGTKLNYLSGKLPNLQLELYGVDPSSESIKSGSREYPNLNLREGTSDELDFGENSFDVIIIGFCLYIVDRELVFKTVSEVDRTLKERGYLVITDFETPFPMKRKYHHFDGVFSYKNNYSDFFTGGGHYTLIGKKHYSHSRETFDREFNERVSTSILFKESYSDLYVEIWMAAQR